MSQRGTGLREVMTDGRFGGGLLRMAYYMGVDEDSQPAERAP